MNVSFDMTFSTLPYLLHDPTVNTATFTRLFTFHFSSC